MKALQPRRLFSPGGVHGGLCASLERLQHGAPSSAPIGIAQIGCDVVVGAAGQGHLHGAGFCGSWPEQRASGPPRQNPVSPSWRDSGDRWGMCLGEVMDPIPTHGGGAGRSLAARDFRPWDDRRQRPTVTCGDAVLAEPRWGAGGGRDAIHVVCGPGRSSGECRMRK